MWAANGFARYGRFQMSRIGHQIISVPESVSVSLSGSVVSVKGPKGELSFSVSDCVRVEVESGSIKVLRENDERRSKALHGLNRVLIANMIKGVSEGYTKELQIEGVGYKGSVEKNKALFSLGFSSPVEISVPEGIDLKINDGVNIVVSGIDKQLVGDFAARIKTLRPAEPYKGKGIRFKGEYVRRKVGKTVA